MRKFLKFLCLSKEVIGGFGKTSHMYWSWATMALQCLFKIDGIDGSLVSKVTTKIGCLSDWGWTTGVSALSRGIFLAFKMAWIITPDLCLLARRSSRNSLNLFSRESYLEHILFDLQCKGERNVVDTLDRVCLGMPGIEGPGPPGQGYSWRLYQSKRNSSSNHPGKGHIPQP